MPTTDATARDICTLALQAIGRSGSSDTPAPADMQFALDIANGMLNAFAMDRLFIYNVNFDEYALTADQQDYEIGPNSAAPFDLAVRPSVIVSAQLKLNTSQVTYMNLSPLDDDGWSRLPVLDVDATYPTAFYYSPSYPDGLLRLWGKPGSGLEIRLETWNQLSEFDDLDTAFSFPQGYYEMIWSNLAERLCLPAFGYEKVPTSIKDRATLSRERVQSLNMKPPAQMICDGGVMSVNQQRQSGYRNLYNPTPIWYSQGN